MQGPLAELAGRGEQGPNTSSSIPFHPPGTPGPQATALAVQRKRAPSVQYAVPRSRGLAGVLLCVALCGLLAVLLWLWQGAWGRSAWPQAAVLGVWLVCACLAGWYWSRQRAGVLTWDGMAWHWQSDTDDMALAAVQLALDLQRHMGLRCVASDGTVFWIWAQAQVQPQRWLALRRAVYSRASAPHGGDAQPVSGEGA